MNLFRIYYHLYQGPSWEKIWAEHFEIIKEFYKTGLLEGLIVYGYPGIGLKDKVRELDWVVVKENSGKSINEFDTLVNLQKDLKDDSFKYFVYMHSKGSSYKDLDQKSAEWSKLLAKLLINNLGIFPSIETRGFNALGSNGAYGVFDDFGDPIFHFSGNFWCTTKEVIAKTKKIIVGTKYSKVRHNAEAWLGSQTNIAPFNIESTGIDHYSGRFPMVNELYKFKVDDRFLLMNYSDYEVQLRFTREMMTKILDHKKINKKIIKTILDFVPNYKYGLLYRVISKICRTLGSKKLSYLYCPKTK